MKHSSRKNQALTFLAARAPKAQAGMSLVGIFVLIGMLLFIGLFALKVVPGYVEFMTVSKIVDDTQVDAELMKSPKSKVLNSIDAAYRQNSLWELKAKDTIKLTKDRTLGYKVEVDYEKRANLFSNIYVVTAFKKDADAL